MGAASARWALRAFFVSLSGCSGPPPTNGALGAVEFTYDCSGDPVPSGDAWCDSRGSGLPDVAVGAPFHIRSNSSLVPVEPAVPGLVQSSQTSQAWVLTQPGWLGMLAIQDSRVLDYTHVRGRNVASIVLSLTPVYGSTVSGFTLSNPAPGRVGSVVADARADDGSLLAGAIPCTFHSSSTLVTVDTLGRLGQLTALGSDDVSIAATCLDQQAQILVHVAIVPRARTADAGTESDGADDHGRDAPADAMPESVNDSAAEGAPDGGARDSETDAGDAADSLSPTEGDGGLE